jgi:light-regulated signal transduction histidine kinase (bacteriophytochrome)
MPAGARVDLLTCADEPIHIPGSIQPHGVLLFFGLDRRLEGWSANARGLFGDGLAAGQSAGELPFPAPATELLEECFGAASDGEAAPSVAAVSLAGGEYDCIVHATRGKVIVEFEQRSVPANDVALFAVKAHGSIDRLRRQKTIEGLMAIAVGQIREITGFDRVMAYRFRQDDSGDVIAEARRDDLTPYLGQRYPAGDIPAQARRLYVLSTLRMISDVSYLSVPMLGTPGSEPLDMSYCVLRSVSPIHVEYLQNMGVGASMSVSIVINGRLWGLIACHHMSPRQVPYAIRMSADVLAQVIASTIQSIESRRDADFAEQSAAVRTGLVESLLLDEEPLDALGRHAAELISSNRAHALVTTLYGTVATYGDVDQSSAEAIVRSLPAGATHIVQRASDTDWPEDARAQVGMWVGMLAIPFDPAGNGWCILLRREQVEEVAWGGRPDKQVQVGPLGARLTPRGSFDAWYETVRGCALPWEPEVLTNAMLTMAELMRVSNDRRAQTEITRAQLLAMLGHDLRDPLHSINMAGIVLEKTTGGQATLGRRIQSSSNRMQKLIGQVLDMSRIDGGIGLGAPVEKVDLCELVADLVDEARMAYPASAIAFSACTPFYTRADRSRLAQVLANLLSNARHHGDPGKPIDVSIRRDGAFGLIEVANFGEPIPPEFVPALFNPFKRASLHNPRNRTGMGLGLYIAQQIVREHQGEISYRHDGEHVVFTVRLPELRTEVPGGA